MSMSTRTGKGQRVGPVDRWVLKGAGAVLVAVAVGLLVFVGETVAEGRLDTRAKHAGPEEASFLYASANPVWFYGLLVAAGVLALYLFVTGARMVRSTTDPE